MAQCSFDKGSLGRDLFDQILDKWSLFVLFGLESEPMRFNAIKRHLGGVTQKALTQCLRKLERNGLVTRRVLTASPIAVAYEITPFGRTLLAPTRALYDWTVAGLPTVEKARAAFDRSRLA